MKRMIVVAAFVGIVNGLGAQTKADTLGYTPKPEVRFGALSMQVNRAVSGEAGPVFLSQSRLNGVEFVAKSSDGAGIQIRYATAEIDGAVTSPAAGKLEHVDAKLIIGSRSFAITTGYRLRTFRYPAVDRRLGLVHGGVRAGYQFTGAGIELAASGTYLRTVQKEAKDSIEADGLEGETSIMYVPPRVPVFFMVGYRRDLLNLKRAGTVTRREELGGILLLLGVQAGFGAR